MLPDPLEDMGLPTLEELLADLGDVPSLADLLDGPPLATLEELLGDTPSPDAGAA